MIWTVIVLALVIEALVNGCKVCWRAGRGDEKVEGFCAAEFLAVVIGLLAGMAFRLNLMHAVTPHVCPDELYGVYCAMSGVAVARLASLLFDAWAFVRNYAAAVVELAKDIEVEIEDEIDIEGGMELNLLAWPLEQLKEFCGVNGINCDGCADAVDYFNAIVHGARPVELPGGLDISEWSTSMLEEFCRINGIECEGCEAAEDFYRAIVRGGK